MTYALSEKGDAPGRDGRRPLRPDPGHPTGAAILVSNTLGTSMGEFLSDSSGLGYVGGAALVTGLLLVLVALMKAPAVPNALLFWNDP
ncbi:hypothetical protein [Streptomyces sp. NPDC088350]|uniref:hypothetical protein n=1 Tax=Streptomyces sp. NPDC088350 TaxID=3365854 RepID=UPI00380E8D7C